MDPNPAVSTGQQPPGAVHGAVVPQGALSEPPRVRVSVRVRVWVRVRSWG